MKTIYVTVEEFVSNNGKLNPGRDVYVRVNSQFRILGVYKEYDERTHTSIIEDSFSSFPMIESKTYVKIKCAPIYK